MRPPTQIPKMQHVWGLPIIVLAEELAPNKSKAIVYLYTAIEEEEAFPFALSSSCMLRAYLVSGGEWRLPGRQRLICRTLVGSIRTLLACEACKLEAPCSQSDAHVIRAVPNGDTARHGHNFGDAGLH